MSIDMSAARSRRALLTAAAGAAAVTVVSAIDHPALVRAGTDGDVVLGDMNNGEAMPDVPAGVGVYGYTALDYPADGVVGVSTFGRGVHGESGEEVGVWGTSNSTWHAGVLGVSTNSCTGVYGHSGGLGAEPPAPPKVGVAGYAAQDSTAVGVRGESPAGTGVFATTATGTALQVAGKAKFSRSGKANVAKGRRYVDITVAGGLTSRSVVHATLQTYRTGVSIAAVRANYPSAGKARIYLTKVASATASTSVGWFVAEY